MPHLCRDDRRTQAKKRLDAAVYDRFREALTALPVPVNYKDLQLLTSSYSQLVGACRTTPIFPGEQIKSKENKHDTGKRLGDALSVLARHTDSINTKQPAQSRRDKPLTPPAESVSATNVDNVA